MSKATLKNEKIKRLFFQWLTHADGCSESTANNVNKSISLYEDFTSRADFATFNSDKAADFKDWLVRRTHRGQPLSIATVRSYIHDLRKFFRWLAWQPGYKSRFTPDTADYLRVTEKEERIAREVGPKDYPTLPYILKLVQSIEIRNEIDQRDRALIAFTTLTGMRDKAIVSLPLGCFDEATMMVEQSPRRGVDTKFSKHITSRVFPFDDTLITHVLEWVRHLKNRGFGTGSPMFPRSRPRKAGQDISFQAATEVEPVSWQGTGPVRDIFKERAAAANLQYYPPHRFRSLAIDLALKSCRTGEQVKAVSQNFGHEHVATTFANYAQYPVDRLSEIIAGMNFSGEPEQDKLDVIIEMLNKRSDKTL